LFELVGTTASKPTRFPASAAMIVGYTDEPTLEGVRTAYVTAIPVAGCMGPTDLTIVAPPDAFAPNEWLRILRHSLGHALGLPHMEQGCLMSSRACDSLVEPELDELRARYPFWR